jgi:hypothetical protein
MRFMNFDKILNGGKKKIDQKFSKIVFTTTEIGCVIG